MRTRTRTRVVAPAAGLAVLLGVLVNPGAASAAPSPDPECPTAAVGAPGTGGPIFTDNGVAVYAGGDYLADGGAAESEGLLVVKGNATVAKAGGGTYNVGTVGVGSGIDPAPGSDMFVVGGDAVVSPGTVVSVGASVNGSPAGGVARVGGSATGAIDVSGGRLTTGVGAAALAPYGSVPDQLRRTSDALAAADATGTVQLTGNVLSLIGDDRSGRQTFRVTSAQLDGTREVRFTGIPADVAVVVTVADAGPVTFSPVFFAINGVRVDDFAAPDNGFGRAAGLLLWNFPSVTALGLGGSGQFMGSVLLPSTGAALDVTASTNGRLLVGGDLHTHGLGNEHHNYPWRPPFGCLDGAFAVAKEVTGSAAGDVPDGTGFVVRYSYNGVSGQLTVRADGSTVDGPRLPIGTVVTLTEVLPTVPGVSWSHPVITVDGVTTDRLTVGAGTVRVVVTNVAEPADTTPPGTPTPPVTSPPTSPPTTGSSGVPSSPASTNSASAAPVAAGGSASADASIASTGTNVSDELLLVSTLLASGAAFVAAGVPRRRRKH